MSEIIDLAGRRAADRLAKVERDAAAAIAEQLRRVSAARERFESKAEIQRRIDQIDHKKGPTHNDR